MKRQGLHLLVAMMLALGLYGCTEPAPQAEPAKDQVLVVDLDRVLKALGKDKEIAEEIKTYNQGIAQRMVTIAQSFKKQLEEKQKEFGDEPTDEQKQVLQNMVLEANQKWQQLQNQAGQSSRTEQSRLLNKFRELVQRESKAMAQERGANIVIAKSPGMLWNVDGIDLTDEVIKRLMASGAAVSAPAPTPTPDPTPAPTPAPEGSGTDEAAPEKSGG